MHTVFKSWERVHIGIQGLSSHMVFHNSRNAKLLLIENFEQINLKALPHVPITTVLERSLQTNINIQIMCILISASTGSALANLHLQINMYGERPHKM